MNKDCIFCKILNNEIPCFKVFEDDLVIAFLDVNPVSNGHVLVVPKEHFVDIFDTPDEVLERVNIFCRDISVLCKEKLGATGVNVLNASGKDAQQSVFHLHFHVVPRFENDGLDLWFNCKLKNLKEVEAIYRKLKDENI